MPAGFMHECEHPGCCVLTKQRYCAAHTKIYADVACARRQQTMRRYDKNRPAWHRLYGERWQRYRRAYLARHPFCVVCRKEGIIEAATEVDHIEDHKGDLKLFWDESNHQALCKKCHSRKTMKENLRKKHKKGSPPAHENVNI